MHSRNRLAAYTWLNHTRAKKLWIRVWKGDCCGGNNILATSSKSLTSSPISRRRRVLAAPVAFFCRKLIITKRIHS